MPERLTHDIASAHRANRLNFLKARILGRRGLNLLKHGTIYAVSHKTVLSAHESPRIEVKPHRPAIQDGPVRTAYDEAA
jgi:hypothetical protein